jgi:hypothetical protein
MLPPPSGGRVPATIGFAPMKRTLKAASWSIIELKSVVNPRRIHLRARLG